MGAGLVYAWCCSSSLALVAEAMMLALGMFLIAWALTQNIALQKDEWTPILAMLGVFLIATHYKLNPKEDE
jgi:hypothetical protein